MSSRVIQSKETRALAFTGSAEPWRLGVVVGFSLAVMIPVFVFGVPSNRDLSNHFRFALPFYDAIVSGNLYPSWLAESNSGFGDPSFRFYPPALYFLLAFSRYFLGNWYSATLASFAVVAVVGGLGMFFWAKSVMPAPAAVWASLFYALAPYHLNQLYQATMLAEWAGSAILPFVFGFLERVCQQRRRRDVAGLAVCYALLVFTHLPLTVIGSLALLVYAIARAERTKRVETIVKLGAAATLGLCASATYWVTMVSEMRWIGINEVERDASVDYRVNFVLSTLSPDYMNVWWMNIVLLMTVLLFAPVILLVKRRGSFTVSFSRPIFVMTAFSLFMTLPLSRPLWYALQPLQQTQFPWRWLSIISMGGSVLAVSGLVLINRSVNRVKRILVLGAMAVAVAFTLSHTVREAKYLSQHQFENTLHDIRGTASVNYWFPIWGNSKPPKMTSEVEAGNRLAAIDSWQPEHRKFTVSAGTETEVRVRTFYYPHWHATSQGRELTTRPDKDGALLISVPSNTTSVNLDFREPLKSNISSLASIAGFVLIGGLALPRYRRRRI